MRGGTAGTIIISLLFSMVGILWRTVDGVMWTVDMVKVLTTTDGPKT